MKRRGCNIVAGAMTAFVLLAVITRGQLSGYLLGVGVVLFLLVPGGICLLIVDFARRKQEPLLRREEALRREPPLRRKEALRKEPSPEPLRERIVTERVLVICPFCGSKTEQGMTKCQNCDADL